MIPVSPTGSPSTGDKVSRRSPGRGPRVVRRGDNGLYDPGEIRYDVKTSSLMLIS